MTGRAGHFPCATLAEAATLPKNPSPQNAKAPSAGHARGPAISNPDGAEPSATIGDLQVHPQTGNSKMRSPNTAARANAQASRSKRPSSRRSKTPAETPPTNGRNYVSEHELRSVIERLDSAADALTHDGVWRGSVMLLPEESYSKIRTAIADATDYLVTLSWERRS
jgi:hypothetical protein